MDLTFLFALNDPIIWLILIIGVGFPVILVIALIRYLWRKGNR